MSAPVKTLQTNPISLQQISSGDVIISSAVDVSSYFAAIFYIHFGRAATTGLTVGVNFRIEGSPKTSGDGHWFPLAQFLTDVAAAESEAVSGTVSSGTNVITVASTTNLVAGDNVLLLNGTVANSEWGRVKSISSNTSITIEDNLVNAQTGGTIYDQAQFFVANVDLSGVNRIRVVVDNKGSGQAVVAEVELVTLDAIT